MTFPVKSGMSSTLNLLLGGKTLADEREKSPIVGLLMERDSEKTPFSSLMINKRDTNTTP